MPTTIRMRPGRHKFLVWGAITLLPFLLAGTCFDTSTAPDVIAPGTDSGSSDTAATAIAAPQGDDVSLPPINN